MRRWTVAAWTATAAIASAAPIAWETTRQGVIEPINAEFQTARNMDGLLHLYATERGTGLVEGEPWAVER